MKKLSLLTLLIIHSSGTIWSSSETLSLQQLQGLFQDSNKELKEKYDQTLKSLEFPISLEDQDSTIDTLEQLDQLCCFKYLYEEIADLFDEELEHLTSPVSLEQQDEIIEQIKHLRNTLSSRLKGCEAGEKCSICHDTEEALPLYSICVLKTSSGKLVPHAYMCKDCMPKYFKSSNKCLECRKDLAHPYKYFLKHTQDDSFDTKQLPLLKYYAESQQAHTKQSWDITKKNFSKLFIYLLPTDNKESLHYLLDKKLINPHYFSKTLSLDPQQEPALPNKVYSFKEKHPELFKKLILMPSFKGEKINSTLWKKMIDAKDIKTLSLLLELPHFTFPDHVIIQIKNSFDRKNRDQKSFIQKLQDKLDTEDSTEYSTDQEIDSDTPSLNSYGLQESAVSNWEDLVSDDDE